MIREGEMKDIEALLPLWLASTTLAHPFISPEYWQESLPSVRDLYLPRARTWIAERGGEPEGFISVLDERFIGALFVAPEKLGEGIGAALLDHAKQHYDDLSLEVYQQNARAVRFYHAQGFRIAASAWQEETQHSTWIMRWRADQTPSR
ncbi:N-acetyltransferase [Franconibacter helveticus]|uniref:N-acetyltransferase n=1 Tax=Franconibacter helveticus TaxID=357240 RepID=UPI000DA16606|nr:N-acetyltransferase [Franconibacter helveticus]